MYQRISNFVSSFRKHFNRFVNYVMGHNNRLFAHDLRIPELNYLLDDRGVDPNYTSLGQNALHIACITPCHINGHDLLKEKIDILLSRGVNPNQQANINYRNTPLHLLIANENVEGAIYLLNKCKELSIEINFNLRDSNNATPLLLASKMRKEEIALHILAQKYLYDVNAQDKDGMTSLHYAAMLGQTALFAKLIECNADVSIINNMGKTCFDLLDGDQEKVKELLKSVEIKPKRDEKARLNNFHDLSKQSLLIRTEHFAVPQQMASMIPPVMPCRVASKMKNIDKIKELLDSDPSILLDSMALVFERSKKPISEQNKKFIVQQYQNFTGKCLLDKCLEGQKDIKKSYRIKTK